MRQPYYEDAKAVIRICAGDKVTGYLAFHSVPNIFYILRKSHSEADRRAMLKKLCCVLHVTAASHEKVCEAIEETDFADLEDFKNSHIKAILSRKFIEMAGNFS